MTPIYTKQGDGGTTRLITGMEVPKNDPRIHALGCVDELQAHLGVARALTPDEDVRAVLHEIQQDLFKAGTALARGGDREQRANDRGSFLDVDHVRRLEALVDDFCTRYPLPSRFITPGTTLHSAAMHVARAVCRRCERAVVSIGFSKARPETPPLIAYFNRLSDLLFVLAWVLEVRSLVRSVWEELSNDQRNPHT